jgi:hypothetical protein
MRSSVRDACAEVQCATPARTRDWQLAVLSSRLDLRGRGAWHPNRQEIPVVPVLDPALAVLLHALDTLAGAVADSSPPWSP